MEVSRLEKSLPPQFALVCLELFDLAVCDKDLFDYDTFAKNNTTSVLAGQLRRVRSTPSSKWINNQTLTLQFLFAFCLFRSEERPTSKQLAGRFLFPSISNFLFWELLS